MSSTSLGDGANNFCTCTSLYHWLSPTMTKDNQLFLLAMLQKARMSSNSAVKNNRTSITTRPHTKTLHSRYINEYVAMPIDTNLDNMIVLRANWAALLPKQTLVLMQACCSKISLHELRNSIWESFAPSDKCRDAHRKNCQVWKKSPVQHHCQERALIALTCTH